jgi:hypothetical protein
VVPGDQGNGFRAMIERSLKKKAFESGNAEGRQSQSEEVSGKQARST